jgi:hypothetical protein
VGAFPVWRPNLDELDVDSAPASAFLILKSFKIIPLQLSCRVPVHVLASLLSDGPAAYDEQQTHLRSIVVDLDHGILRMHFNEKKIDKKNLVTSLFSLYST